MPPDRPKSESSRMLVNDLSIEDARDLLRNEGGELRPAQVAIQLVTIAAVAATCARAIWVGRATAWHLALPMAAQYLTLLVLLPIIYALLRLDGMRKEARDSLRAIAVLAATVAIAVAVRARLHDQTWTQQFVADVGLLGTWITAHQMQWPMLCAAAGILVDLPGRIRNLVKFGPPFYAVGLGCGMRIAVLFLGCFLLPFVIGSSTRFTWFLWAAIVVAELLTIGMHWDIQRRLRRLDSRQA
jgi:hypothetical protein